MLRHFIQMAEKSSVSGAVIEEICAELDATAENAIDATLASLPKDFPEDLAASITGGIRARLRLLKL